MDRLCPIFHLLLKVGPPNFIVFFGGNVLHNGHAFGRSVLILQILKANLIYGYNHSTETNVILFHRLLLPFVDLRCLPAMVTIGVSLLE